MLKKVKIGGLKYKVSNVDNLDQHVLVENMAGLIDYREGTIRIASNLSEQMKNHTLIHEITHGILVEAGFTDHEEEQADRIGKVLYQVLKDNDFSFLRKG